MESTIWDNFRKKSFFRRMDFNIAKKNKFRKKKIAPFNQYFIFY